MRTEPYFDVDSAALDTPLRVAPERRTSRRQRRRALLFAVLAVLAIAAIVSVLWQAPTGNGVAERPSSATPGPAAPVVNAPLPRTEAAAKYPVAASAAAQPPLDMSDATLLAGLAAVFGDGALSAYIERTNLVRRIVATIDNVPRRSAPPAHWPVKPAAGQMATSAQDGPLVIAPTNGFRYSPYVRLLESVNTARFVELYRRHYALFEQAYRELGFPEGHFNDRAVEAIDVLLASPSLAEPPRLVQPKVFLQFADRDLEQLPAGQKLMLRIGSENAQRVKVKLAEIRAAITDPELAARR